MNRLRLHELKIRSEHFEEVLAGRKTSEVRMNDRDYQVGDILFLQEVDKKGVKTGQALNAEISHILTGGQFGIDDKFCVISLANTTHLIAKHLINYLRDHLAECCACIECSYEIIQKGGCTTDDAERTVTRARAFLSEANAFIKKQEVAA